MLNRGGYLHPVMATIFPYRADRTHRVRLIEQADGYASDARVLRPSHVHGRSARRAEELVERPPGIGRAREVSSLSLDPHLLVRIVGCLAER